MHSKDAKRVEKLSEQRYRLGILVKQKPELFEKINLWDYSSDPLLENLDEDRLTEGGVAGWITVDDDHPRLQTYRFYWNDVENYL